MKALTHPPQPRSSRGRTVGALLIGIGFLALLVQGAIHARIWWQQRLPEVQAGDVAQISIKTPVNLVVEDVSSTQRLRDQEAKRIRPVFTFDSQAAERLANRFLEKYDSMQIQFLRGMKKTWDAPMDADEIQSDEFTNFVAAFRIAHSDFPISDELATQWAGGDQIVNQVRSDTAHQIREHQRLYVAADQPLPESAANHSEYWLLSGNDAKDAPALNELKKRAHVLPVKSVRSHTAVRADLVESVSGFGGPWSEFVSGFLEPNLLYNGALTEATRREATNALIVHKELAAGETLIEMGKPVGQTQIAALAQLGDYYDAINSKRKRTSQWLIGLGSGCVLCGALLRRRPRPAAFAGSTELKRTKKEHEMDQLRSGLLNQMSRWLKEKFIIRLIDQRNEALENQSQASAKVDQMNTRLNSLQPEIQKRIASYEKRIEDLERELVESNAVNKELIRTRIKMAQKELEIEKAKSNLAWN